MKKRKKGNEGGTRSVKVAEGTYKVLSALVDRVSRDGWAKLGFERSDRPSIAAVIDAAAARLAERG